MDQNDIALIFDDGAYVLVIYYSYLHILNDIKHSFKNV